MEQCYDSEKNKLLFMDSNGVTFDFQLRGKKTIIHGDSATGKSLLCTRLREIQNDYNQNDILKKYSADNIVIADKVSLTHLKDTHDKLIIIDRADIVLSDEMKEYIKEDVSNSYLIFIRGPIALNISPKLTTTTSSGGLLLALQRAMLLLAPKGGVASTFTGPL